MKRFLLLGCLGVLAVPAVVVPALVVPAWAAQTASFRAKTAGELADLCGAAPGSTAADAKINYCHGFAQGAIETRLVEAREQKPFCFPNPAPTRTETMNQFVSWTRALPANHDLPVLTGLFRFLGERFPCSK